MALPFRRDTARRKSGPCGVLALIPIGIIFGIIGVVMLVSNLALVANGVKTTGTVVDSETKVDQTDAYTDSDGTFHPARTTTSYFAVVEFATEDGSKTRYRSSMGSSIRPTVGSTRAVIYDKGNPSRAQDDSASNLWIVPLVLIMIGLISLAVGIIGFLLIKKAAKALIGAAQGAQQGGVGGFVGGLMGGGGAAAPPAPPAPANAQLAGYVRQSRAAGMDDAAIRATLSGQGWSAADIDAAFR